MLLVGCLDGGGAVQVVAFIIVKVGIVGQISIFVKVIE